MTATATAPLAAAQSPVDAASTDFSFASGHWHLTASGGTPIQPVLTDDPRAGAREAMARLGDAVAETGRSHIVYGLIPFDTRRPTLLRLTDTVQSTPRTVPPRSEGPQTGPSPHVPESDRYRRAVASALAEIERGTIEKVVLARHLRIPLPHAHRRDVTVALLLDRLAAANARADVFHVRLPDGGVWLGASPEIVADVHHGTLVTHPLAGSRPRRAGEHAPDDDFVTAEKDRREHGHVVRHIREALAPLTETLEVPAAPSVFPTDRMWHLGTRITGHLRPGVSALEAALALHPTPAVCGTPTAAAATLIAQLEEAPRDFYAGLVGWTDASGDGRWSLVLRSAHLVDDALTLHAGAGVVAGSDPAAEHDETAAKFTTMLSALEAIR